MAKKNQRFEVDTEGLAQIVRRRGVGFVVLELISNAWDTNATEVHVKVYPIPNQPKVSLYVKDNHPEGFEDMRDVYTLYKYTKKRSDPNLRGRFNIGEKEVLSLCEEAKITSTTGTIIFDTKGNRKHSKKSTDSGSEFSGIIRMTREEMAEVMETLDKLIPPKGVTTYINGEVLKSRTPLSSFKVTLDTELEKQDGSLGKTKRKTVVNVYKTWEENPDATIYEMGIPICQLPGDKWHIDVQQKVPLPRDRDTVYPSYLTKMRVAILNHMHDFVDEEDSGEAWVKDATSHKDIEQEAFEAMLHKRHGEDIVSRSVDDQEANHAAQSAGYEVLTGRTLTGGEWQNAKRFETIEPAGKVFPTDRPSFSADGNDLTIPKSKYTEGMKVVVKYLTILSNKLLKRQMERKGEQVLIKIVRDKSNRFSAWYGNSTFTINLQSVGHRFFNEFPQNLDRINDLMIHELGHEVSMDHLDRAYYNALTMLGSRLTRLALDERKLFPKPKKG